MSAAAHNDGKSTMWDSVELNSCFELQNGVNFSAEQKGSGLLVVDVLNMYSDDLYIRTDRLYRVNIQVPEDRLLRPGDVLFVRSSVKESGVGWPAIFKGHDEPVTNCGFLIRARQTKPKLDPKFFVHYLRQYHIRAQMISRAGKVAITNINQERLGSLRIPLPPLAEQRRIAAVLDGAEALRAKRRAALAQLDSLTQSLFLDLFGDPATNPKGWPMVTLKDVLSIPLRNGLSPSKSGKVHANVLTLSAITGNAFDASAWKSSTFISRPPANQSVSELDFLICRGNGNVHLVGKGCFPTEAMPEMTFPDTMIAARIISERIERAFLQHVWNSPAVRKQVESVARTTNGTFKVNQPSLEGIQFVSPPIALQREFARRIAAVEKLKTAQRASLAALAALFAALQHRVFKGEL